MSTSTQYRSAQIGLHWLMAALIIGGLVMGLVIGQLGFSPFKLKLLSWHKWNGITVLLLIVLRIALRATLGAPALPDSIPVWQRVVASWTHYLLYLLMILIPLSGWLMTSAKGIPVVYFGLWQLPDLIAADDATFKLLRQLHGLLNWTLMALLAAHIAGALKHHLIDHDDILARMLPFLRRQS